MSEKELKKTSAYVWFDAEFTSLELESARLLQVAVILTDHELKRLHPEADDINLNIRLEEGEQVSPWVEENLSGLVTRCRSAGGGFDRRGGSADCGPAGSICRHALR